jgi:L-alanine-DL-glutamate epimerase-like enolase superfamily enzyme
VDDVKGYRRVSRALRLPIAGGENHYTRWDMQPLVEAQAVSILQPDVMRGGLTELRKIAAMAEPWGIRIAPHLFPELMVHLLCSIPNGLMLEYMGWMDDLLVDPPLPRDGMLRPPEAPGHGLAFQPTVLADHQMSETA